MEGWGWPKDGQSFESTKAKKALGRDSFIRYDQSVLETAKVFERYV